MNISSGKEISIFFFLRAIVIGQGGQGKSIIHPELVGKKS